MDKFCYPRVIILRKVGLLKPFHIINWWLIAIIIHVNIFWDSDLHRIPNPETNPADGPPAQFIEQWTADNPVYMRFGSDGVSVQKDYKLTYNVALDEDDEKNGRT